MSSSIRFYKSHSGNSPVEQYLESLDDFEAAPVLAALSDISRHGLKRATVQLRAIRGKLWELKAGKHRVFYVLLTGPEMVLLHACKKQSQKARRQDLALAQERMKEVLDSG
jgi:phage-related protein